jgi:predicted DNA-binding protein (UPF0251 family)
MPKVSQEVVENYNNLIRDLPQIIDSHKLEKSWIANKANMSRSTFLRKLKSGKFTGAEALRVVKAINL